MFEIDHLTEPVVLLRLPAVRERVGMPTSTIYRRIAQGTFPKPIKIGAQSVAWLDSDIRHWLRTCCARSRHVCPKATEEQA